MPTKPIATTNSIDRTALDLRAGDTIRVWQKIKEKDKIRLQAFEGLVLARKHGSEAGATFTVRKVVDGVGVERIYPFHSPMIDKIDMIRRSKVRRAKLYYIREKAAKEIRHNMRKMLALDPGQNTDTKIAGVAMSTATASVHEKAEKTEKVEKAEKTDEKIAPATK
jgi:large subunit ribosomal protein L19